MLTMNLLRILADISFYCTFAAFIAASYGGSGAFPAAIWQCLCFALASLGGRRRPFRLLLLLPMALSWYLCRSSLSDCLLIAPTGVYILYLTWVGDYSFDRDRQYRIFNAFWRVAVIAGLLTILLGGLERLTAVSLPYAMITLTASVLLLRSLRHEPKVYCQTKYQLVNMITVAVLLAAALFFSSEFFLSTCLAAVQGFYRHLILPILMAGLWIFMLLVQCLIWLAAFLKLKSPKTDKPVEIDDSGFSELLAEMGPANEPSQLLRSLFTAALIAVILLLLFLFFRWLSRKRDDGIPTLSTAELRTELPVYQQPTVRTDSSPVRAVRSQYRKFLKLCAGLGLGPECSSTSRDVDILASQQTGLRDVSGPIREIYIQARYAGRADKNGVRQIKKLYAEGKKNLKL